jgi:hypothetical protein
MPKKSRMASDLLAALIDELTDELATLGEIVVLLSERSVVQEAQREIKGTYC